MQQQRLEKLGIFFDKHALSAETASDLYKELSKYSYWRASMTRFPANRLLRAKIIFGKMIAHPNDPNKQGIGRYLLCLGFWPAFC